MNALRKLFVSLMTIALSTLVNIWIMTMGWGLSAQRWNVIIGGAAIQFLIMIAMQIRMSDDK